jgi:kynurenine formamidase
MNHYLDLSHSITSDMPCHDGDPQVSLRQCSTVSEKGHSNFVVTTGMHSGTHVDGPMHLTSSLARIAEIPLEKFTGTGYLVNVFGQKIIELSDQVLDHILPGSIVLFYSGFDLYYNQKEYFLSYPVLSESTAMLLVKKKVKMIGIDSPSPDYHPYTIHNILLTNNILILENLTNLSSLLPYREFEIMAFPLKIRADSSPVRVVARVTK